MRRVALFWSSPLPQSRSSDHLAVMTMTKRLLNGDASVGEVTRPQPIRSSLSNGFKISETSFSPSDRRRIVKSSDDTGWSDVAVILTSASSADEYAYLPNTAVHLGLSLQPLACEIESDHFSGKVNVNAGQTSVLAPQSRVDVRAFTSTSTFHAYIKPSVFAEVADEMYGRKFDYVDLIPHFGGPDSTLSHLMYSLHHLLLDEQKDRFRNEYVSRAITAHILTKFAQSADARKSMDVRVSLTRNQMRVIDEFLTSNLHGKFYFHEIAATVGMSRTVFFERFSHTTRQTPNQYLQKLRVDRARSLLQKSDLSLADVALACGFSDQSHMTRFFLRHTGTSPGKYRTRSL